MIGWAASHVREFHNMWRSESTETLLFWKYQFLIKLYNHNNLGTSPSYLLNTKKNIFGEKLFSLLATANTWHIWFLWGTFVACYMQENQCENAQCGNQGRFMNKWLELEWKIVHCGMVHIHIYLVLIDYQKLWHKVEVCTLKPFLLLWQNYHLSNGKFVAI